jgi:hypothetical protein
MKFHFEVVKPKKLMFPNLCHRSFKTGRGESAEQLKSRQATEWKEMKDTGMHWAHLMCRFVVEIHRFQRNPTEIVHGCYMML